MDGNGGHDGATGQIRVTFLKDHGHGIARQRTRQIRSGLVRIKLFVMHGKIQKTLEFAFAVRVRIDMRERECEMLN